MGTVNKPVLMVGDWFGNLSKEQKNIALKLIDDEQLDYCSPWGGSPPSSWFIGFKLHTNTLNIEVFNNLYSECEKDFVSIFNKPPIIYAGSNFM